MSKATHRPRRARRTPEEIDRILRAYDRSGLSQVRFAKQHRIALTTLHYWLGRRRQAANGSGRRPALVPVSLAPGFGALGARIEIALPNGRELRVPLDTDAARVASLVAALDS